MKRKYFQKYKDLQKNGKKRVFLLYILYCSPLGTIYFSISLFSSCGPAAFLEPYTSNYPLIAENPRNLIEKPAKFEETEILKIQAGVSF